MEDRERGKGRLNSNDAQAGNAIEVAGVARSYRVTKLQRASSDDQVAQWNRDAFRSLFATNAGDDLRCSVRHRIDGDSGFQFIEEQRRRSRMSVLLAR